MKKFKRRLSLTLRGSQTIDESLSELAEQMTIEENSSKDNGKHIFSFKYQFDQVLLEWMVLGFFIFHSCMEFLIKLLI